MDTPSTHDFYADTFDVIDGRPVMFNSAKPDVLYEVTNLLDADGEETDDPELAVGGVVKFAEECYSTFTWGPKP